MALEEGCNFIKDKLWAKFNEKDKKLQITMVNRFI